MITMGELMSAINGHRIVRMASGERTGEVLPGMCGEYGVVNPDYEAGLNAYFEELERLVESIYSEATDTPDRKFTLDNGTIEGSTYVTVDLGSKDATMALLSKFFVSVRHAVYEHFHPEIDQARQERIRAHLATDPPIGKHRYDPVTRTVIRLPECTDHQQT